MSEIKDPNQIDLKKFFTKEYAEVNVTPQDRKKAITSSILYVVSFFIILVLIVQLIVIAIYKINEPYLYSMQLDPIFGQIFYSNYSSTVNAWTNFLTYLIMAICLIIINKDTLIKDYKKLSLESPGAVITKGLIGYGLCIATSIIASVIVMFLGVEAESANEEGINSLMSSGLLNFLLMATPTIILAPIVEELVFRKSLFNLFQNKFSIIVTIILSSVLFGSIHVIDPIISAITSLDFTDLYNELVYLIAYSVMGLGFALSYQLSKQNVLYTIVLHSINNFSASLILYLLLK